MPQGSYKSRKTLSGNPPAQKKKATKNILKIKKGKTISSKKAFKIEGKKLKQSLEKAINARIEEDVKALATHDAQSLKILKSSDQAKKKSS
ncbi:hypothetical protein Anas_08025 [Armadillidium nasatum]|uniref:Uncharacterized protein n=1 Tax=Armadillidium nasatum TaxID=96803 RepID=A0A5N5TA86_9CRUS|nr:hypothetical protein Anas_08025 [Armadillidium nasatum]